MSSRVTRRQFVLAGAAGAAAAAIHRAAGAAPSVLVPGPARPVVVSASNGAQYKNGGAKTCVEEAFERIARGEDVVEALVAGVNIVELDPEDQTVGYGGLPSNHSAIVSSTAALIALREGMGHPAFGVAVTLAFIVMLDASSLRRQVGRQAEAINALARRQGHDAQDTRLRERMGHTRLEIAAGILVGIAVAALVNAAGL